jgi:hypothetical protein
VSIDHVPAVVAAPRIFNSGRYQHRKKAGLPPEMKGSVCCVQGFLGTLKPLTGKENESDIIYCNKELARSFLAECLSKAWLKNDEDLRIKIAEGAYDTYKSYCSPSALGRELRHKLQLNDISSSWQKEDK